VPTPEECRVSRPDSKPAITKMNPKRAVRRAGACGMRVVVSAQQPTSGSLRESSVQRTRRRVRKFWVPT